MYDDVVPSPERDGVDRVQPTAADEDLETMDMATVKTSE